MAAARKARGDDGEVGDYGWASMRTWCLWQIDLLLGLADNALVAKENAKAQAAAYAEYENQLYERHLNYRMLRKLADPDVRAVVEDVTGTASEAAAIGGSLPGELQEARDELLIKRDALRRVASPAQAVEEFKKINARFAG